MLKIWKKGAVYLLSILFISQLTACSDSESGSGNADTDMSVNDGDMTTATNSTANDAGNISVTPSMPARLKTISYDIEQNGSIDQVSTFSYDDSGRILSEKVTKPPSVEPVAVIQYNYENGNLIRKYLDEQTQDIHSYVDGRLVASTRYDNGKNTYKYNNAGQLIESTGDQFGYGKCESDDANVDMSSPLVLPPTFVYSYAGRNLDSVVSSDGIFSLNFTYENSKLTSFLETLMCGNGDTYSSQISLSYDSNGQPVQIDILDIESVSLPSFIFTLTEPLTNKYFSSLQIQRAPNGQITSSMDLDETGREMMTTRSYNSDGLPESDNIVVTGQSESFFQIPNQTLSYTYEDGTCQVSYSSDPTVLVFIGLFASISLREGSLACGYTVDRQDF